MCLWMPIEARVMSKLVKIHRMDIKRSDDVYYLDQTLYSQRTVFIFFIAFGKTTEK